VIRLPPLTHVVQHPLHSELLAGEHIQIEPVTQSVEADVGLGDHLEPDPAVGVVMHKRWAEGGELGVVGEAAKDGGDESGGKRACQVTVHEQVLAYEVRTIHARSYSLPSAYP
jgi:hypothetical protein